MIDTAIETIVKPTVQAMADEGTPFTGILYAGLIATADGPKVIVFNARFGDPETEVVLPKLTSDLGAGINAILNGETPEFTWDEDNATLGVVIASEGYPTNVVKGAAIPEITVDDEFPCLLMRRRTWRAWSRGQLGRSAAGRDLRCGHQGRAGQGLRDHRQARHQMGSSTVTIIGFKALNA